jgi:hypothetical protein
MSSVSLFVLLSGVLIAAAACGEDSDSHAPASSDLPGAAGALGTDAASDAASEASECVPTGGEGAPECLCPPYPDSPPPEASAGAPHAAWANQTRVHDLVVKPDGTALILVNEPGRLTSKVTPEGTVAADIPIWCPYGPAPEPGSPPTKDCTNAKRIAVAGDATYLVDDRFTVSRFTGSSVQWTNQALTEADGGFYIWGMEADSAGVVFAATRGVPQYGESFIARIDSSGLLSWSHPLDFLPGAIALDSTGRLIVAGGAKEGALVLTRHDATGAEIQRERFATEPNPNGGSPVQPVVHDLAVSPTGELAVVFEGFMPSELPGAADAGAGPSAVAYFDAAMVPQWMRNGQTEPWQGHGAHTVTFTSASELVVAAESWQLSGFDSHGTATWSFAVPSTYGAIWYASWVPERVFVGSGAGVLYFAGYFVGKVDVGVDVFEARCGSSFVLGLQ